MNDFKVSKALTLPNDFALEVLAVLAKRGAGKTYDAAVVAEEMLKAGIPIVVVDGMGRSQVFGTFNLSRNFSLEIASHPTRGGKAT
jgi:hypothetical protein